MPRRWDTEYDALTMLTREAILAVHQQGADAVVELVEGLSAQLADQQEMIASLTARINQLEDRLAKNSRNSSKPPSSDDGISKPKPKSLRRKSGKKPGGQKGHPGVTLSLVENPEHVVLHSPKECEGCGRSLSREASEALGYERRQVVDVPALLALEVTEHRAQRQRCLGCGITTTAPFPVQASANSMAYGSRIKALCVYLMEYQLLPYERTSELLEDLFGSRAAPGVGTLYSAVERCFEGLKESEEAIKEGLKRARVAHFDETGLRVGGEGMWVHVASTDDLTHYAVHGKRGAKGMEEIGILPLFEGVAVHDGLSGYRRVLERCAGHALCNAHHLRELRFVEEEHKQRWAGRMKALLSEIEEAVREEAASGGTGLEPERVRKFGMRYQRLLEAGLKANPPPERTGKRGRPKQTKGKNLVDRLDKHRCEVLRFMHDFRVPFDNNRAERDIRMVKVRQKISGCFRTRRGAEMFCRIRGYISTVRKQGENVLAALESVFVGDPLISSLRG